jgi:ArsR family transcriptional regulator
MIRNERSGSLAVVLTPSFVGCIHHLEVTNSMPRKTGRKTGEMNGVAVETLPEVSEQAVRELAQVFKLLSDETRLRILFYLAQNNELHVTDLCNRLGQSQPAVSHHLALLRVSGLIESRREGKHNFYSVRTDHFGELLVNLFSATGEMPKRVRFHDFVLTYSGE